MSLLYLYFSKNSFAGYKISGWHFFPRTLDIPYYCILNPIGFVFNEKSAVYLIEILLYMSFFSCYFQDFLFVFIFQHFYYDVFVLNLFMLILPYIVHGFVYYPFSAKVLVMVSHISLAVFIFLHSFFLCALQISLFLTIYLQIHWFFFSTGSKLLWTLLVNFSFWW